MAALGYIQVFAYTSRARIPLEDVAIMITDQNNSAISMGLTDKSGKFGPVELAVPDKSNSLSPDPTQRPYTTVNIHARINNYEQIEADDVQVFAGIITTQNLEMIPLSELPDQWSKTEFFNTPSQNL